MLKLRNLDFGEKYMELKMIIMWLRELVNCNIIKKSPKINRKEIKELTYSHIL